MVRVLTLTNWYPPHHHGGYELSCFDVMIRLEQRGHEVHVLCGDTLLGGEVRSSVPDHEARVRRQLRLYHDGSAILRPPWRVRLAIERHNQRALIQAIDEIRPDVVSVWHLAGVSHSLLDALARRRIPVVFSICDDWLTYGLHLDPWCGAFARSPLRRALGALAARVVGTPCTVPDIGELGPFLFVTRATEATALATARWHPARRAVVWSGIDRATFAAPPLHDRGGWGWRLLSTGRFDPRKGFETAIRALALLPVEARLELWGRGGYAERDRLSSIAEAVGVAGRVSFGTLEREQLPERYVAADVMIFPSTWPEPFGLVPIEAMACGTPVVATGVGGSAEFLVDGGNCLLFAPGDAAALAEVIARLAADPELRGRLIEAGMRTAEDLDVERLADVMEAWHVYEAGGRVGPIPADRPDPGVGPSPVRVGVRLGADGTIEIGYDTVDGVLVDPRHLPLRAGAVEGLRVDLEAAGEGAPELLAEIGCCLRPGRRATVRSPNPADARLLLETARRRWRGDRRPVTAPQGSIGRAQLQRSVQRWGSVVDVRSEGWHRSRVGRLATPLLALAPLRSRAAATILEVERRVEPH